MYQSERKFKQTFVLDLWKDPYIMFFFITAAKI